MKKWKFNQNYLNFNLVKLGLSGEQAAAISPVKPSQSDNAIAIKDSPQPDNNIEQETEKIKAEYEERLSQMQQKFDEEQGNKKRLGKKMHTGFCRTLFSM